MKNDVFCTVKFTYRELYLLTCLLANGVCDFDLPGNEGEKAVYDKIHDAFSRARRQKTRTEARRD